MSYSREICIVLGSVGIAAGAAALPARFTEALATQKEIYIATQRANGERSNAVPIWFMWDGEHLYFTTSPDSWKAKRIARGSPVFISTEGRDGPFHTGRAEAITDLDKVAEMGKHYNEKYWIAWLGFFRPRPDRVHDGKTDAFRVTFETS